MNRSLEPAACWASAREGREAGVPATGPGSREPWERWGGGLSRQAGLMRHAENHSLRLMGAMGGLKERRATDPLLPWVESAGGREKA